MWKKLKENWKTYLLIILSALFGADQVATYAPALAGSEGPEAYETGIRPDKTWAVVAYVYQLRKITGQAMPAYDFWDCLGKETIFVESWKAPTMEQIVAAYDPDLAPEQVKLKVLSLIPPEKWKEEEPGEIPRDGPDEEK